MAYNALTRRVTRTIRKVRRIRKKWSYRDESDICTRELRTRYALIDPILKALGWELDDPTQVKIEFEITGSGSSSTPMRVDYALFDEPTAKKPSVIIEAKSLTLGWYRLSNDSQSQLRDYAFGLGLHHCYGVITNGNEWKVYRIYRSRRPDESEVSTNLRFQTSARVLYENPVESAEKLVLIGRTT